MRISVTAPIERAWNRMVDMLFKPFDLSLWFGLGLCVFLANLGRGGGAHFNFRYPSGGGGPVPADIWDVVHKVIQWIKDNPYLFAGAVLAFYTVTTLIWALVLWLRSRGVFMTIDNLAFGRGWVKDPWRSYRKLGNNLFKFNIIAGLIVSFITTTTLVVAGFIMWPDIVNEQVGTNMIWALILLTVVIPLTLVNYAIMEMLLIDFIAPTMYLHDLRVGAAWKLWYNEIVKGHFWVLVLFYLMKLVLLIAVVLASVLVFCLTCCIVYCLAALPYIGTVILLPAFVFMRCYTLYFLEQFGEPWRLFVYETGEVLCVSCGYDLRGNPDATTCPECGSLTPTMPTDEGPEVS